MVVAKKPTYKLTCTKCGTEVEVEGIKDPTQSQTTFVCEECNTKNNEERLEK